MKQYAELKYKYLDENVLKNLVKTYQGLAGLEVFFSRPSENKLILDTKRNPADTQSPKSTWWSPTKTPSCSPKYKQTPSW